MTGGATATGAASKAMTARIVTRFDERKTAAAAAVLLKEASGAMRYFRLLKLLYLADRESWLKYNRPITGDCYFSMPHGPVLSETYDLIRRENSDGPWARTIELVGRYDLRLRTEAPDIDALSEAEIEILREAYRLCETMSQWKLRDLMHTLPEWKDPEGSSKPIFPEEILEALGKTPEEIDEARQEAAENASFDELLGV